MSDTPHTKFHQATGQPLLPRIYLVWNDTGSYGNDWQFLEFGNEREAALKFEALYNAGLNVVAWETIKPRKMTYFRSKLEREVTE